MLLEVLTWLAISLLTFAIIKTMISRPPLREMGIGAAVGLFIGFALLYYDAQYTQSVGADILIASAMSGSFVLVWFLSRRTKRKLGWLFCFTAWALWSLEPHFFTNQPLRIDSGRFKQILPRYPTLRIGLTLSGGGYRAAFMHAGVLSAIDDLRLIPANISAVSGGSITAAFYVMGGNPEDILLTAQHGKFDLKRQLLLLHNAIRLPFPAQVPGTQLRLLPWYEFSRTDVQANLLDQVLYKGRKFGDLDRPEIPRLMLCATDLASGKAIGITPTGMVETMTLRPMEPVWPQEYGIQNMTFGVPLPTLSKYELHEFPRQERVADMVVASGAFPLAFEPVVRDIRYENFPEPPREAKYRFADGGLTDNTGLTLLLALENVESTVGDWKPHRSNWLRERFDDPFAEFYRYFGTDLIITSDAGALFGQDVPPGELSDAGRAIDVIYGRVVMQQPTGSRGKSSKLPPPKIISISPQNLLTYPARLDVETSKRILAGLPFTIAYLDEDGFRAILSEFPKEAERLAQKRRVELQTLNNSVTHPCSPIIPTDTSADHDAASLIQPKLSEDLQTFLLTGTLNDRISPKDARNLYSLGRYLLFLKFSEIQKAAIDRINSKNGTDCEKLNRSSRTTEHSGR